MFSNIIQEHQTFVKIAIGTSEFPIQFRTRLNGITKQNDLTLKKIQNNLFIYFIQSLH